LPEVQPFSRSVLNDIFTISTKHPDRISSRESTWLEFKEAFSFVNLGRYIRSAAAFANARGGYIVYGIKDKPHTLVGLQNSSFDDLDPALLSHFFNEHFDPEIHWDRHLHELNGKIYGLLYICESKHKPVMCKKGTDDGKSLKEGEIYYRYGGRTQTIKYADLRELIDEHRRREQDLWFQHLKEIARIGVYEVGIFDSRAGKVSGAGGSFLIDESLLPRIAFIREGGFDDTKGKPAIKIIGEARVINGMPVSFDRKPAIVKTRGIRGTDVILAFLNNEKVQDPQSYLTQICYETSAFLPCYFLIRQAGLTTNDAMELINNEPSTSATKHKLIQRMKSDTKLKSPIPSPASERGRLKLDYREDLVRQELLTGLEVDDLKIMLSAMQTLERHEINEHYLKDMLLNVFTQHYARHDRPLTDQFRRTVAYLDWILNISAC
jgi:hypothetical protein